MFDFGRRHRPAGDLDHVLDAADECEPAVFGDLAEVCGAKHAVWQHVRRLPTGIAHPDARAADLTIRSAVAVADA